MAGLMLLLIDLSSIPFYTLEIIIVLAPRLTNMTGVDESVAGGNGDKTYTHCERFQSSILLAPFQLALQSVNCFENGSRPLTELML